MKDYETRIVVKGQMEKLDKYLNDHLGDTGIEVLSASYLGNELVHGDQSQMLVVLRRPDFDGLVRWFTFDNRTSSCGYEPGALLWYGGPEKSQDE